MTGKTHEGRADGYHLPLVPCLHHRRVDSLDGVAQSVKITANKPVVGELLVQHVKELHQACRYVLWRRERSSEGQQRAQVVHEART